MRRHRQLKYSDKEPLFAKVSRPAKRYLERLADERGETKARTLDWLLLKAEREEVPRGTLHISLP